MESPAGCVFHQWKCWAASRRVKVTAHMMQIREGEGGSWLPQCDKSPSPTPFPAPLPFPLLSAVLCQQYGWCRSIRQQWLAPGQMKARKLPYPPPPIEYVYTPLEQLHWQGRWHRTTKVKCGFAFPSLKVIAATRTSALDQGRETTNLPQSYRLVPLVSFSIYYFTCQSENNMASGY